MKIKNIYETSYPGMYKVSGESGSAFFVRPEYIPNISFDLLSSDYDFNSEEWDEILDAGLACVVELKAVEYLARAEQSRFGLNRKLSAKNYNKKYIDMALTFLESKNYLNDFRYSCSWLHSRVINHYEGKTKLIAELQSRGISKENSVEAVNQLFQEIDENVLAEKAYRKFLKQGKSDEKLVAAMLNAGFSYKIFKEIKLTYDENDI